MSEMKRAYKNTSLGSNSDFSSVDMIGLQPDEVHGVMGFCKWPTFFTVKAVWNFTQIAFKVEKIFGMTKFDKSYVKSSISRTKRIPKTSRVSDLGKN